MAEDLVVIGAAGVGRRCLDIVQSMNAAGSADYNILGVYDDRPQDVDLAKLAERGIPYLGTIDDLMAGAQDLNVILGIGYPGPRSNVRTRLNAARFTYPTLVDPHAHLGSHTAIGQGVIVSPGCLVGTQASLGDFTHLTPGVNIGHDTVVQGNVTISSGATIAGNVAIGESSMVGAGAIILQGLDIGDNAVIGAGAVVTKSVPADTTVKGVPAK